MIFPTRILFNVAKTIPESGNVEKIIHIPVMASEITRALSPKDGSKFIDLTFGGGGHTKHLLSTNKKMTIFCLDRDPEAFQRCIVLAKDLKAKNNGQQIVPLLGRFSELPTLLANWQVPQHSLDGAIMDLGTSSFQMEDGRKGFSVRDDGPLDMRMDGSRFPLMPTAADVVNSLDTEELTKIFKQYGEERHSRKIANAIVDARFMMKSLNTTRELATLVENVIGFGRTDQAGRKSHSATKVFQALRIFVNNELNEINYAVEVLAKYLKRAEPCDSPADQLNDQGDDQSSDPSSKWSSSPSSSPVVEETNGGGLLAAISFHSLEDRIIKNHFMGYGQATSKLEMEKNHSLDGNVSLGPEKVWKFYKETIAYPSENEVFLNPKARSAKLRIGLRI